MAIRFAPIIAAALCIAAGASARAEDAPPRGARAIIGMATMKPDGTIVIELHGGPEQNYALGHVEYPPASKDYAAVLRHLGGLAPGETKGVTPWREGE